MALKSNNNRTRKKYSLNKDITSKKIFWSKFVLNIIKTIYFILNGFILFSPYIWTNDRWLFKSEYKNTSILILTLIGSSLLFLTISICYPRTYLFPILIILLDIVKFIISSNTDIFHRDDKTDNINIKLKSYGYICYSVIMVSDIFIMIITYLIRRLYKIKKHSTLLNIEE